MALNKAPPVLLPPMYQRNIFTPPVLLLARMAKLSTKRDCIVALIGQTSLPHAMTCTSASDSVRQVLEEMCRTGLQQLHCRNSRQTFPHNIPNVRSLVELQRIRDGKDRRGAGNGSSTAKTADYKSLPQVLWVVREKFREP